ncbi:MULTISPECIES: LysR family transcriptional regulator [unclassified Rhizobium]|uniref:LysR family transcriptional regulator n=1 Tax=unclassified Rhizobium TaxID=2613769 RepID=UPI001AE12DED|nr:MULTISPECIES: LysR family transcriptional regulator [unclassified Rhizobium]
MNRPALGDLDAFMAIVAHRSFRKAADELGLAPSTLSHLMRTMEKKMGVRLLHRTTRSVAPTEAGERLAARLGPALKDVDAALEAVDTFRSGPRGSLRINSNISASRLLLKSIVPTYLARYPEMTVDLVSEGRLIDIVAEGFDAGVRLREAVPQDMIAVPFGGAAQFVAVVSPAYVNKEGRPQVPDDLAKHRCIRLRLPSGKLYRWEFEKNGEEMAVEVPGSLILDNIDLMVEVAAAGLGIAYVPRLAADDFLESGRLLLVLDDWCPKIDGLCLYYSGHRHVPAGLRAFIDLIHEDSL